MGEKFQTKETLYVDRFNFINFRKEKGGGFVFNPFFYEEKWVDEVGFDVFTLCDGTRTVAEINKAIGETYHLEPAQGKSQVEEYLKELQLYCAIKFRNIPATKKPPNGAGVSQSGPELGYYSAPTSVLWDLTYRCNMKCMHCLVGEFSVEKEMNLEQVEATLLKLKEAGVFSVHFSGGEPLIRGDIYEILKKTSQLNLGIAFSSNGLLLNDEVLRNLLALNAFCLQISLDGIGDTHDNFRGVKGGYEKAVSVLKSASSKGMYTIMSTTVTALNLPEISQLLDLAVSLGVSSFKVNEFMPVGRDAGNKGNLSVSNIQLRMLAQELTRKKREHEGKIQMNLGAVCPWLLDPEPVSLPAKGINASIKLRCSAGHTSLTIAPDGEVYACPYLTNFPLGNILYEPFKKIWNNNSGVLGKFRNLYQEDLKGKCKTCRYTPKDCTGGCRAASYIASGDFYGEDMFCWKPAI